MIRSNRVIFSDNAVLSDLSVNANNPYSQSDVVTIVAAEDKLYVGSDLPFNHRYFLFGTNKNTNSSVISIDYWDGKEWENTIDILDQTDSSGAAFGQSGEISWSIPKKEGWVREDTNDVAGGGGDSITGLTDVDILDLYWARFNFSADMTALDIKFIGHKFSSDEQLGIEYPELLLSDTLNGFESGKTTWDDQHFKAASDLIRDLRRAGIIGSSNQILESDRFSAASVHKVAEIIYRSFGDDFRDNRQEAFKEYKKALDLSLYNLDLNRNARLDPTERTIRAGTLHR